MGCRMRPAMGLAVAIAVGPGAAIADEGGVSFWLPGQNGSFAAVAPSPGWSMPLVFYNLRGICGPRGHLAAWPLAGDWPGRVVRRVVHRAHLYA
jgi:hypothetical protein